MQLEWCHEFYYKTNDWQEPRKIVLVVNEVPGELLLRYFFLVTNLCWKSYPRGQDILRLYRKRDKAEAHMGELKSTLNVHLSSTCWGASTVQQVMARNQVNLLLSLYSYQLMHALRFLLERQSCTGWSIRRLREQVLKTAATVAVHARRIIVHLSQSADKWWPALLALPRFN